MSSKARPLLVISDTLLEKLLTHYLCKQLEQHSHPWDHTNRRGYKKPTAKYTDTFFALKGSPKLIGTGSDEQLRCSSFLST